MTTGVEAHTHDFVATAHDDQKFGFSLSSGAADEAVRRVLAAPSLDFAGLHSHIGSQIYDTAGFDVAAHRVLELAARIRDEHGVHIETGPHKHTIQQSFFLYIWDPAGNRIELDNPAARLMLAPDWQSVDWTEAERAKGQAWGLQTIIAAIAVETGIVGKLFRVTAKVYLLIRLVERAECRVQLTLAIAFESRARNDVENSVGSIAIVG